MTKKLDHSSKASIPANRTRGFRSKERLEFSLASLCSVTNRNMRRVFELPIRTIAKCTRATTTTMIEEDEVQARMVPGGERNLGVPRVLMCTCLHSKALGS